MWKGEIKFDRGDEDKIKKICVDITNKDVNFIWKIIENKLIIECKNKNDVYRKVVWLINKVKELEGCPFKILRR